MAVIPVPTLSPVGYARSIEDKADFAMAYLFAADKSQTSLFDRSAVTSIPWILQNKGEDIPGLMIMLRDALYNYLQRYFDSVECSVDSDLLQPATTNQVQVKIDITVTDNGLSYSFGRLLNMTEGRFTSLTKIMNDGV